MYPLIKYSIHNMVILIFHILENLNYDSFGLSAKKQYNKGAN